MPFIITTHPPIAGAGLTTTVAEEAATTRTAVSSLADMRDAIYPIVVAGATFESEKLAAFTQAWDIPADGGTIGPLPDGTMIEVRPVSAAELARLAGCTPHAFDPDGVEPLLDAFNAK